MALSMRLVSTWLSILVLAAPAGAFEVVGTADTPGSARDVARSGDFYFVADGTTGVRIIDASDPALPVEVGFVDTPPLGNSTGIAVAGNRAYVADGFGGLRILDVTTPSAPSLLGEVTTGAFAYDVAVAGSLAYLASGDAGLVIVDVSDPLAPEIVGSAATSGPARGVALAGTRAYVANESNSCLEVFDVSDPAAPFLAGSAFGLPKSCNTVELVGGAALAQYWGGVTVFELSDPDAPQEVYLISTPGAVTGIDVVGSLAYVGATNAAVLYDVSGALAPPAKRLGSLAATGSGNYLDVLGNRAYLANRNVGCLEVVDVSDPENPVSLDVVFEGLEFHGVDAVSSGGQVLVYAAEVAGFWIFDATDPNDVVPLGQEPLANFGSAVTVVGSLAYVGDGEAGFKIIDVSNPADPDVLSAFNTPGLVREIQVVGTVAYVADHDSNSLRIVNVANPNLPLPMGQVLTSNEVTGVVVKDGLAYFTNGDAGLRIYNVSNAASPVPLGQVVLQSSLTEYAQRLDVVGQTAYVITAYALWIIDVSDPSDPTVVTRVDYQNSNGDGGNDVVVKNGLAYVSRIAGGVTGRDLVIWDVSEPGGTGPVLVATATGLTGTGGIVADVSGRVGVADGSAGLRVLDAADEVDAHPCIDGLDNDGDAQIDAADAGCESGSDASELPACDDGLDNDGDGKIDYGLAPTNDPGCRNELPVLAREDPQCQDGVDNDGDGAIDHPADTRCQSLWDDGENTKPPPSCGLGIELALPLLLLRRRPPPST